MSGDRHRLRAVGTNEETPSTSDVPIEVLRFATLPPRRRSLLMQVNDLVDEIAFGTVVMVIHQGTVTQIEAAEKIRLSSGPVDPGDQPPTG